MVVPGITFGGRQHSAACRKRYQDWYDAQQRPAGVQPQGGMPDIAQQADNDPRVPPPALIGDMPPAPVNVPPELSAPIDPSGLKPVKPDQASSPKVRINVKSPPHQVQLQAPPSPRSGPQVRKIEQVPDVDMEVADVSASSSAPPQAPGHPAVPGGSEDMDVSRLTQAWEDINQPRPDTTINSLLTRFTEPPPEGESDRPLMPFYIPKVGEKMVCKPHQLCGRKVFLVEPNLVKSQDNSESLNISDAVKARKIEMDAMSEVRFGEVIDQQAALAYCQKHGIKPISTRWVVNPKVIEHGWPAPFATGFESLSVSNRIGSVSAKTHRCIYSGPENACVTRRCPPGGPEWRGPAPPSSAASTSITTTTIATTLATSSTTSATTTTTTTTTTSTTTTSITTTTRLPARKQHEV